MITFELAADDVAASRFAISPLHETVLSLFTLYLRQDVAHARWARDVRRRPEVDHALLHSLVSPAGQIPDFLTPPPQHSRPSFGEQLAQVRATPAETVLAEIRAMYPAELPPPLKRADRDPVRVRDDAIEALTRYWELVIAPHWLRMRAILEADVLYRGLQCAQDGAGAAFAQLNPEIRWTGSALQVDIAGACQRIVPPSGQVIQFIPSLFVAGATWPVDMDAPPVVGYRSRRAGLLWQDVAPVMSSAIATLLGRRRATVLASLDQPRSTVDLARMMGVTPSAVSQHLAVLSASRLVERARVGKVVLYTQSLLGRRLVYGDSWTEFDHSDHLGDLTA